jgi:hypothetical protein
MKALTMSKLKKRGDVPLSPKDRHQRDTGTGNYNRFNLLQPNSPRPRLGSKRKLDPDPISFESKSPRLDQNTLFGQLKEVEDNLVVVKSTVSAIMTAGDSIFNIGEGGLGAAVHKLALAVNMLVCNQEKLLSAVVDAAGSGMKSSAPSYAAAAAGGNRETERAVSTDRPTGKKASPPPSRETKLRQAIAKAEKSTVIFNANLGNVPVMNKDTLARKVTILLHDNAKSLGEFRDNPKYAEEAVDDFLSCATLDFLGKGTKPYFNRKNTSDELNNKFCTVPVKLSWKSKGERIRGEQALRKVCKAKCSVPYPKNIRTLIDEVLKAGQSAKPGLFIRVRVVSENLTVVAHAREDGNWVDLHLGKKIPLDSLDSAELQALGDANEMEDLS